MSKVGISLNINVKAIEKARLIDGKKGAYLNATVFVDLDNADQYGNNGMITQDVSKEEREGGAKGPILGNAKVFWREGGDPALHASGNRNQKNPTYEPAQSDIDDLDSSIPF